MPKSRLTSSAPLTRADYAFMSVPLACSEQRQRYKINPLRLERSDRKAAATRASLLGCQSRLLKINDAEAKLLQEAIDRVDLDLLWLWHGRPHEWVGDQPAQPRGSLVANV